WLYVASGLWTTAITATIMVFAFAFLAGFIRVNVPPAADGNGPPPHVIGALLTAFVGFGLATLLTTYAVILGLCYRLKLWLSSAVHAARRGQTWPPPDTPGRGNKMMWLVLTTMLLTVIPAVLLVIIMVGVFEAKAGPGNLVGPWLPMSIIAALVGGPFLALVLRDYLARRIIARTASECWSPYETWSDDGAPGSHEVTEY
ncbi:MAG TPA: hypothetical protein VKD72_36420, partial [Gemmataceae bacterium]|nr:hypothetical protein [Gemmataceae bacterium]